METVHRNIKMRNPCGLHIRFASDISSIAHGFDADVKMLKNDSSAALCSIFDLLALGAVDGDILEVSSSGRDADKALNAICDFIDDYHDAHLMKPGSEKIPLNHN